MRGKLFALRQAFNSTLIPQPIRSTPTTIFSQISRTLCSSSSVSSDSRQPAVAKLPFVDAFLAKMKNNKNQLANKKVYSRRSTILPEFVDQTVRIYNGKNFVRCKITESKVGHKFGEFSLTRKRKFLRNKIEPAKKKAKQ